MSAGERAALDELLAPLRESPDSAAVLCDVDGTLAPIVIRPEEAAVAAATRDLLRRLADRYALVACVSGRRATEARRLVGLNNLFYIGNHGYELLDPGAAEPELAPGVAAGGEAVAEFVAELDPERLRAVGLRLEDKGPIQAIHWRGAPSRAAAELEAREIAAAAEASGLVARWGRMVLELRPPVATDKGSAIEGLLDRHDIERAVYGGDDVTDLDAFRALRARRVAGELEVAVCVAVYSDEGPALLRDQADLVVEGVAGFATVLEALA